MIENKYCRWSKFTDYLLNRFMVSNIQETCGIKPKIIYEYEEHVSKFNALYYSKLIMIIINVLLIIAIVVCWICTSSKEEIDLITFRPFFRHIFKKRQRKNRSNGSTRNKEGDNVDTERTERENLESVDRSEF